MAPLLLTLAILLLPSTQLLSRRLDGARPATRTIQHSNYVREGRPTPYRSVRTTLPRLLIRTPAEQIRSANLVSPVRAPLAQRPSVLRPITSSTSHVLRLPGGRPLPPALAVTGGVTNRPSQRAIKARAQ